jgi:hypothetical protein
VGDWVPWMHVPLTDAAKDPYRPPFSGEGPSFFTRLYNARLKIVDGLIFRVVK